MQSRFTIVLVLTVLFGHMQMCDAKPTRHETYANGSRAEIANRLSIAIWMVGGRIFLHPVDIHIDQHGTNTTVSFYKDHWDSRYPNYNKATDRIVSVRITNNSVGISPMKYLKVSDPGRLSNVELSRVAILACSYFIEHSSVQGKFTIYVSHSGANYEVLATDIPAIIDRIIRVSISEVNGKLYIKRIGPLDIPL